MKILKSELQKIILEVTQGEMEFAELEAARRAYIEDKNVDTRHELGLMVEKLVEPIMAELGLFFEAEAFYNRGEIVFSNIVLAFRFTVLQSIILFLYKLI